MIEKMLFALNHQSITNIITKKEDKTHKEG